MRPPQCCDCASSGLQYHHAWMFYMPVAMQQMGRAAGLAQLGTGEPAHACSFKAMLCAGSTQGWAAIHSSYMSAPPTLEPVKRFMSILQVRGGGPAVPVPLPGA